MGKEKESDMVNVDGEVGSLWNEPTVTGNPRNWAVEVEAAVFRYLINVFLETAAGIEWGPFIL